MLVFKKEEIGSQEYNLLEHGDLFISRTFDHGLEYGLLHDWSKSNFKRHNEILSCGLTEIGFEKMDGLLPREIARQIIQHRQEGGNYFQTREGVLNLLEAVFNEQIDQRIIAEFGSEYMPVWYNFSEDTPENTKDNCSFKWHCDGGPKEHIKIMIYLNDMAEHGGNTIFSTKQVTEKLKEVGYVFCMLKDRKEDVKPLVEHHNVEYKEYAYELKAGDGLIFSPANILHRGSPPKASRHVLHICIVPSPYHWKEVFNASNLPTYGSYQFINFFNFLKTMDEKSKKNDNETIVQVDGNGDITTKKYLKYILDTIFDDKAVADEFYENFVRQDPTLSSFCKLDIIVKVIENSFKKSLLELEAPGLKLMDNYRRLLTFKERAFNNRILYSAYNKPDPNAVFWPDPTSESNPLNLFDMLPYVKKSPIMTKKTPVGSAGSCFAFEIAEELQKADFNYVITEKNDDPSLGVIVDGYNAGDPYVKFCANWGIMFNSPSFMQLAEKAFGKFDFQKILYNDLLETGASGLYFDPYRENVFFINKESYLRDYEKHISAVREAFLTCKVFIITLGLNECWQFVEDGTFMSRNPRPALYPYLKHKTLTVEENLTYLQRFLDIIREHNPDFKLVVTLSPIPFLATGRAEEHHIVSANCHSKAVLRVVAEEFMARNEGVYYLPSYELVMHCSKNAWEPDFRHVNRPTVKRIIEMFQQMFVENF